MAIEQEICTNPAAVEALSEIVMQESGMIVPTPYPAPITNGYFNRRIFLETLFIHAANGTGVERETIIDAACMTDREFDTLKTELIEGEVIEEKKIFNGTIMYSFKM